MKNFAQQWLNIQCQSIDSVHSALLLMVEPDCNSIRPVAQWPIDSREPRDLVAIAQLSLAQKQKTINQNVRGSSSDDTLFDYLALPVLSQDRMIGVIAVKMDNRSESQQQQVTDILESSTKWLELSRSGSTADSEFYPTIVKLMASCLEHDSFLSAATAIATELSVHLNCERVSLGILKRRHIELRALSNSAKFDRRSNMISAIGDAMDEAVDQDALIIYPGENASGDHINRAHGELSRKFGAGSICTIPIVYQQSEFGALTLENSQDNRLTAESIRLCEQTLALVTPFLALKLKDEKPIFLKCWDTFKSATGGLFAFKHIGAKLTGLVVALLIAMAGLIEGDFSVHADAVIEGKVQRIVPAPFDGYLSEANFRAGDVVEKGNVLASLNDKDLQLERVKLTSKHAQLVREYREAMAKNDLVGIRILNAQIAQTKAERALIDEQLARIHIVAPFKAVIIEGDLSQSLGSPVVRGDSLFKIAPLEGYRIILKVDETDIAYISKGKQGQLALASLPGKIFPLQVEKITAVSNAEDGSNTFRVEASLRDAPTLLRPGMEGIGKIHIGEEKYIWIWCHSLFDRFWLMIWPWMP